MSMRANLVEIQAFSQYIHTLAADAGYHVYFDIDTGQGPYSTAHEIHLNKLHENLTNDDLMTVRGQVVRQVGHKLFTDFDVLKRAELQTEKDKANPIKNVWMDLEDHRVDYLSIHKLGYEGDKSTLSHTEEEIQETYLRALKKVEGKQLDNDSLASLVTAAISLEGREEFLPAMGIYADKLNALINKIPPGKHKAITRIRKRLPELLANRAITDPIAGSVANLELARKIVQDSKQEDDEDDQPDDAKANADSEEDEGEEAKGETVVRTSASDLNDSKKGEPAENNNVAMKSGDITPLSSVDEMMIYSYTTNKGQQGAGWSNDWTSAKMSSCNKWDYHAEDTYEVVSKMIAECSGQQLQNEVRRILQVRSQCVRTYNRKKGKLAGKDAYRVTMTEARGFNERVFMQQKDGISLDVAVSLLIDYSGSMHGTKIQNAIVATQLLADTLKTLDIRHEVAGFSAGSGMSVTHLLFKEFHGQSHDLTRTMCKGVKFLQMNSDGDNILLAANRLRSQRERRKVLIVLSDGQPASYKPGSDSKLLQYAIDSLPDAGVEVIGIGICTDHGEDVYPVWETLHRPQDLEQGLLNVLRNTVFKV